MKKAIKTILTIYMLLLLTVTFGINNNNISLLAATNTNSEYVNTVTDLKTTDLMGGVTLYEQKMTSLLNGDKQKAFQEHFVQWVDLASYSNANVKLVTWTKQSMDNWTAATTKVCALDWEKNHPGWIVIAGTNGDFFSNSGDNTKEPTNNFMADGGDTYYVFSNVESVDTGVIDAEGLISYVNSLNGVIGEEYATAKGNITIK